MNIPIVTRMLNPPFRVRTSHVLILITLYLFILLDLHLLFDISMNAFIQWSVVFSMMAMVSLPFFGWNEHYPIKHEVTGQLNLSPEGIEIGDSKFKWEEIEKVSVEFNDYKGKRLRYPYRSPTGPCLSQGMDNYIRFIYFKRPISIEFSLIQKHPY